MAPGDWLFLGYRLVALCECLKAAPSPVFKAGAKDKRLIPSVGLGDFGDEGRRLR